MGTDVDDIKLPAAPWLGHDPERGDVHGFSHDEVRAMIMADRERRKDKLAALKRYVCDPRSVEYFDKVIHFVQGSAQAWKASFLMLDPLPDDYDRSDLDKPRLTPEQAFDRFMENLS